MKTLSQLFNETVAFDMEVWKLKETPFSPITINISGQPELEINQIKKQKYGADKQLAGRSQR